MTDRRLTGLALALFALPAMLALAPLEAGAAGTQEAPGSGSASPAVTAPPARELPGTISFHHSVAAWHKAYFEPIFAGFAASYPQIKVESVEIASGGYEALTQTILLGAAAGKAPDISQVGYSYLRTLAESGRAAPLDSLMGEDPEFEPSDYLPAMRSLGVLQGTAYLMPFGTSTPVMYLNADALRKAGLDPAAPPASWEQAAEAAGRLTATGIQGLYWSWDITGNWIFQTMVENAGGLLGSADGRQVLFDGPAGEAALTYLDNLVTSGLMPKTNNAVPLFLGGKLGMLVSSSAGLQLVAGRAPFPVSVSRIPTRTGSAPRLTAGGTGLMIFADSVRNRALAWTFLKYLTRYEASMTLARTSGYLPAHARALSDLRAQADGNPNFAVVLEQAPQVVPWHSWPGQKGPEIAKVISEMEESVIIGNADVRQALRSTAERVRALLP